MVKKNLFRKLSSSIKYGAKKSKDAISRARKLRKDKIAILKEISSLQRWRLYQRKIEGKFGGMVRSTERLSDAVVINTLVTFLGKDNIRKCVNQIKRKKLASKK